jgi:3-oxoacyl-(acyl-carrier-protein) synthase
MSISIAGAGWVTPLGGDVAEVWERLCRGEQATAEPISDAVGEQPYLAYRVPENALTSLPRHPRLRRASVISRFAAAAGVKALDHARSTSHKVDMQRVALVFAVANGGVIYTKRFYHDVAATGAQSASPLLFPETVFNAPASHLAALLGIEGVSYTLVSDGAVGALAIKMAEDLLGNEALDYCLVVAAEEADWLLCDAYHKWRLLRRMVLSEGAGAILLGRDGKVKIDHISAGRHFFAQCEVNSALAEVAREILTNETKIAITSANGTFIDAAETAALSGLKTYSPKAALGESVGASALWQVIVAAQCLTTKRLPPNNATIDGSEVIVLSCGMNQQVGGLRLSI